MTRENAIKQLKDNRVLCINSETEPFAIAYDMAIKALGQEPKWIPVSEKLPEESLNSVIGWDAYRKRCVFIQYYDRHFQITGSDESFDIKAWMPLPEPYKAESEDKE